MKFMKMYIMYQKLNMRNICSLKCIKDKRSMI